MVSSRGIKTGRDVNVYSSLNQVPTMSIHHPYTCILPAITARQESFIRLNLAFGGPGRIGAGQPPIA